MHLKVAYLLHRVGVCNEGRCSGALLKVAVLLQNNSSLLRLTHTIRN
jgi:hypothetical protein